MGEVDTVSSLKNTLKTLCCDNGWSYAIFWRFDPRNSLLLTVEDAYYQEQLGVKIANMLPQVHLLGEGIVGQAAFTGKHRWVLSDAQTGEWNLTGAIGTHVNCEDGSELCQQFSSGIKTIAVISVKGGVVQFGSKQKILETVDFLEQTQRSLMGIEDVRVPEASANTISPFDCENYDLNGLLTSFFSSDNSYDWNHNFASGDNSNELPKNANSSTTLDDSFPSIFKIDEEEMTSLHGDSSCLSDQLTVSTEARVALSNSESTDVLLKSNSSINNLIARNSFLGSWSGEVSSLALPGHRLVSELRAQDVTDVCCSEANTFASSKLIAQNSALSSLYNMNRLFGQRGTYQDKLGNSLNNQHSAQSSTVTEVTFPASLSNVNGLYNNLKPVDMLEDSVDGLCQWFAPSPDDSICRTVTALDSILPKSIEFYPTSSGLAESGAFTDNPLKCSVNLDGQETSVLMQSSENSLLDCTGLDLSCDQAGEWLGDILIPLVSATTDTGLFECLSELNTGTLTGTQKGLFSELCNEELLNGVANSISLNKSNIENQLSNNKRQRTEDSPMNSNPTQLASLVWSGARADLVQPVSDLGKTNNLVDKKEIFPTSHVGLWIDDSQSANTGRAALAHLQKLEEPTKATRKRARPGESTRPRPKDRQQIQDRIKELRGIIPNGVKCSIDSLLDRTIKYLLFLQSVTKYADKLQEPTDSKLTDKANGVVLKDKSAGESENSAGVTWAVEVADQTLVCPIIVEDMSSPGQMLIEFLCGEQDFFLEIADIIRGFGLNILKGKMEIREDKIWARFIVEANRHVTRIDIFWSLIQLLQQTNASAIDSVNNKPCDVIDAGAPSTDNYQKTEMPLPMAVTEILG